jgi:carbonic anhydrase
MQHILDKSDIIKELIAQKNMKLIGGIYDVSSGEVSFFEE